VNEDESKRKVTAAVRRLRTIQRADSFDPSVPDSKPTEQQLKILKSISKYQTRWTLGGNQSGKSQLGGRDLSWVLTDKHPYFRKPEEWGTEALSVLVMGRLSTQVEEELWNKKLKPFFSPGTYKEVRTGNVLQKVKFTNGNIILFFSHHAPEEAREKVQSFVLHYIWLDEMPDSIKLIEELQRRLQAKRGRMLATFTPKIRNEEIRKLVDTASLTAKKFKLHMLSNPIYKGREHEILDQIKTFPDNYKKTILEGDWYVGDSAVYEFNREFHVKLLPISYSRSWRHVLSVDPAASGQVGLTLWAEDPVNATWYCVKALYMKGQAATDLDNSIELEIENYRIVRRISDPHEVWFIKEAEKRRHYYIGVYKKTERKNELIKGFQERITNR